MSKNLQQKLFELENYYSSGKKIRKTSRKFKIYDQKSILFSQHIQEYNKKKVIEVRLHIQFPLKISLLYLTEHSLLALTEPEFDHNLILGEIPGSFFSHTHRVGQLSYDYTHNYLHVEMDLVNHDNIIPLDYVMSRYKNFQVLNQPRASIVIDRIKLDNYKTYINDQPSLGYQNWMDHLLENEELPAFVQRFIVNMDKPVFEYVFNQNYMRLAGILPNIMMDVILQSKQIPELSVNTDLMLWTNIIEGFIDSHQKPRMTEYKALVMTYEGVKVGVIVKELYLHTCSDDLKYHYYVRKVTYQITNPSAHQFVFDYKRINNNSMNYLKENKTYENNNKLNKQLLFETDPEMLAKYKMMKPCGYKLMSQVNNDSCLIE